MIYIGNTAPYHITQPSTDNDVQIVSPTATMASVTCSLNITIPSTVIVSWTYNITNFVDRSQITQTGNTTTLLIENLQPSDAGDYQCVFNDAVGSGWTLRRSIRLFITGLYVYRSCATKVWSQKCALQNLNGFSRSKFFHFNEDKSIEYYIAQIVTKKIATLYKYSYVVYFYI